MTNTQNTPPDIRSVLDTLYQAGMAHADLNISFDTSANFRLDEALQAIQEIVEEVIGTGNEIGIPGVGLQWIAAIRNDLRAEQRERLRAAFGEKG